MEQEILTVSVSQLNHYIRRVIEHNGYLKNICVKGEISNCKLHPTGHIYLTLKDDTSLLRSVMFRSDAASLRFRPEDGMKVLAQGRISVYEAGGSYQLYIESMTPDGEGALYLAFEQLKKKLDAEGLFDASHKKPLPKFPRIVTLITASSGAAVRDMLNVIKRRWPIAQIKLFPVSVQGDTAAPEIVSAIQTINRHAIGDVIILGRGGGSIEDLWAFNEEIVARAIFDSVIPIISAVGHETDFTIADFVADLRAPTPSAAAELAVPNRDELLQKLHDLSQSLVSDAYHRLHLNRSQLERLVRHPSLASLSGILGERHLLLDARYQALSHAFDKRLDKAKSDLSLFAEKLNAISPLAALGRGFSYASLESGETLSSVSQLEANTPFNLRLSDGTARCLAEKTAPL